MESVFSSLVTHCGTPLLELSLWTPDPDEGAKLLHFQNPRHEAPLEIQMEAAMLFAMDEASQVDRRKLALRKLESGNLLVSIRSQDDGPLIGAIIFSGGEAIQKLSELLALQLGDYVTQKLGTKGVDLQSA